MTYLLKTSRRLPSLAIAATVLALVGPLATVAAAAPSNEPATPARTASSRGLWPLERAHAHNDYEHARPLFDALDHGFTSVEADVWLQDGELRVAHDESATQPGRTLQSLYLDPLRQRVRTEHGSVYAGWHGSVQLLIDVKSDGPATYAAVDRVLRQYPDLMTRWTGGREHMRPVTAVISGNRDREVMTAQTTRYAGYDGRLSDLGTGTPASFMPLVSDNWTQQFTWLGVGPMPSAEREKLHRIVAQSHAAGYTLRFWATPDLATSARESLWRESVAAGVDYLNTDDLAGLESFLRTQDPQESRAQGRPLHAAA